jgi:hypothetical protein
VFFLAVQEFDFVFDPKGLGFMLCVEGRWGSSWNFQCCEGRYYVFGKALFVE